MMGVKAVDTHSLGSCPMIKHDRLKDIVVDVL
jgi:hypothetical protein